nr:unnamed protein product [Callosobruchus chinensis]
MADLTRAEDVENKMEQRLANLENENGLLKKCENAKLKNIITQLGGELSRLRKELENSFSDTKKVHPSHGVCYIPFNYKEIAYPEYEILVLRH